MRHLSSLDQIITSVDRVLRATTGQRQASGRPNPADNIEVDDIKDTVTSSLLTAEQQQHSAGLMRVNYTGEVAAQALYLGQALIAKDPHTQQALWQAASEEGDHLQWCHERLQELNARQSYLNPLWFLGSLTIGAAAAIAGDHWSLGFVVETEHQVEQHLSNHLKQLPKNDHRSRAIIEQMRLDEIQHGQNAQQQGAAELPCWIKKLMRIPAKIMTSTAYYF